MKPNYSDLFRKLRETLAKALRRAKIVLRFLWIILSSAFPWPCLVYSLWKLGGLLGTIATASASTLQGHSQANSVDVFLWAFALAYTAHHTRHDWHEACHRLRQLVRAIVKGYVVIRRIFRNLAQAAFRALCSALLKLRAWWRRRLNG